jgi:membrane protease subunit (stomatin/prohibitin family)
MDDDEKLSMYLEMGAVELAGMDESGEFIFQITEKAKDVAPELWQAHQEHIDRSLVQLYEAGLIRVTYNDNLEAIIEMSEEGHELAKELGLVEINMHEDDIPND